MATTTARTPITSYDLSDYDDGPPRHGGFGVSIDMEVAHEATCSYCGHQGCGYRGYHRPGAYRAFAVCPECGHAEEF